MSGEVLKQCIDHSQILSLVGLWGLAGEVSGLTGGVLYGTKVEGHISLWAWS